LAIPIALPWLASFVRAYPYGGSRVLVYAAPALLVFIAAGAVPVLDWLRTRTRAGWVLALVVLLSPAGRVVPHIVVPDGRADCAGAAAYVLRNRQPADTVLANHWEYLYYFRHLGPALATFEEPLEEQPAGRVWVVLTDARDGVRMDVAQTRMPSDWQMLH